MNTTRVSPAAFELGGRSIRAGSRAEVELSIARWVTGSPIDLAVLVHHGRHPGPTIWLSAAIHGDELNGVEIIRRVLQLIDVRRLHGTILAVPVVNVPGFVNGDRYLPDRRDLNRSFPGSPRGSLAGRIAHLFLDQVASRCSVGVDLHTGSGGRFNLPQVRADLTDDRTRELALTFGAPATLHARERAGSLRQAASRRGATALLYEAGEALRFDEACITVGVNGILRLLSTLDMIPTIEPEAATTTVYESTSWVRARRGGATQLDVAVGDEVVRGQLIGRIYDSFGRRLGRVTAPRDGTVIGLNLAPILHQGDAVAHLAEFPSTGPEPTP